MKNNPVIVNFIPDNGTLEIWIGNERLLIDGFLRGHHADDTSKIVHSKVLDDYAQKKLAKKIINNLLD